MMEMRGVSMNRYKNCFLILFLIALGCARKQSSTPVYNEQADARHDIAAAIANVEVSKKNIVLIFGANW